MLEIFDVLQNVQTVQVSSEYIMSEGRGLNIDLGQDYKHILLSPPSKRKLFIILPFDRNRKIGICQINNCLPCTLVELICSSRNTTSGTVAAVGDINCLSLQ